MVMQSCRTSNSSAQSDALHVSASWFFSQPVPMKPMYSPGCDLQAAAQKVQKRLLNKPRHPAQLAADIVERVVATGGEPYLDTKAQTLSWWQLSLLDVKLFLAVVATALLCGLGGLLWVTARVLRHVGRRMLGRTWRKRAVQRKKVR